MPLIVFPYCKSDGTMQLGDLAFGSAQDDATYQALPAEDRGHAKRLAKSLSMPGAGVVGVSGAAAIAPPQLPWFAEAFRYWLLTDQEATTQLTASEIVWLNDPFRSGGNTARVAFARGNPGLVVMRADQAAPAPPFGQPAPHTIRPDRTLPGFDLALLGTMLGDSSGVDEGAEDARRWLAGMRWMNIAINDALPDLDVRLVAALNAYETVAKTWSVQRDKLKAIQNWASHLFAPWVAQRINEWLEVVYRARSKVVHGEPLVAEDITFENATWGHIDTAWWTYAVALLVKHARGTSSDNQRYF